MSDKIYVDKELLKKFLEEAFEKGWTGYKDLKEEVANDLMDKIDKATKESSPYTAFSSTPMYYTPTPSAGFNNFEYSQNTFTVGNQEAFASSPQIINENISSSRSTNTGDDSIM